MGAHASLYLLLDTVSIIIFSEGMRSLFHLEVEKKARQKNTKLLKLRVMFYVQCDVIGNSLSLLMS